MKRLVLAIATLVLSAVTALAQGPGTTEVIYISTLYTTHIVFSTDLTYGNISNQVDIVAQIIDKNKNIMAIKAVQPFVQTASVTALESNGTIHTFILAYKEHPDALIIDKRPDHAPSAVVPGAVSGGGSVASGRKTDAPLLKDVVGYPRQLYHLVDKYQKVEMAVENVFAYSDNTYITVSLENNSGVSYKASDAVFMIENRNRRERKIVSTSNLVPHNRYGSLSAAPGETGRCAYTLDKVSLSKDQVLKVYVYESDGQRNLEVTLAPKDVNLARSGK